MRKRVSVLVSLFVVLFISADLFAETTKLSILHFNDFHGRFVSKKKDPLGNAARLAGAIHKVRRENKQKGIETIVLFGGDAFSGSLISSQFKGKAEIEFLNKLGIDAMVIGNHEFDFGSEVFIERMKQARFPVISGNVYWKEGAALIAPATHTVTLSNGIKVGILGLTTIETPKSTHPRNVEALYFEDPEQAAKRTFQMLDPITDIQIALTHQGVPSDRRLASVLPGLEAVIGGHDHVDDHNYFYYVGKRPVTQAPAYGRYIGRLDFEINGREAKLVSHELIPVVQSLPTNRKVARLVKQYEVRLSKKFRRVIGFAKHDLTHTRKHESILGNIVADSILETTGTDIAVVNSGGLRKPLVKGKITLQDLHEVHPFNERLIVLKMNGRQVERMLHHSLNASSGAFLQVSGIRFYADGSKVTNIFVGEKELKHDQVYSVTTIASLVAGVDGYDFLQKSVDVDTPGMLLVDAIINYIKRRKEVSPVEGGRIFINSIGKRKEDSHQHISHLEENMPDAA